VGVEQLLQGGAFPQGGTWEPANLGKNTRHTSPGWLGKKFQNKNIKTSYLGLISLKNRKICSKTQSNRLDKLILAILH
jgi:hypothetical protein